MKVGDLVRPHPDIRHDRREVSCQESWFGVILEMHKKSSAFGGSRQTAIVCWNCPGFQEESQWTYQLEVISECR
jgi:hypothetical protein